MNDSMRSAPIKRRGWRRTLAAALALLLAAMLGCSVTLPESVPQMPNLPSVPGMPADWGELQGMLGELGLPDLSRLEGVPGVDALDSLAVPAGALAFQGPLELGLEPGEAIPGTDMRLTRGGADGAEFEIAGMRAVRRLGDSLDFDGPWPGMSGVSYHLRLRVYRLTDNSVRAAGVQRVVVENVQPQAAAVTLPGDALRFPITVAANAGGEFPGLTLGYVGQDATRGAQLRGLPDGEYPYRKIGDSVEWQGRVRADIAIEYQLRMLYYQSGNARIGGVVLIALPSAANAQ